jgi:hypothetical protein
MVFEHITLTAMKLNMLHEHSIPLTGLLTKSLAFTSRLNTLCADIVKNCSSPVKSPENCQSN